MLLLNATLLLVSGGLTNQTSHSLTPSHTTLVIPLTSRSPHTITGPVHWGHSVVLIDQSNALVSGGISNGMASDSLQLLSPLTCDSITDSSGCSLLPYCVTCINGTDFVRCYHSNESGLCSDMVRPYDPDQYDVTPHQFVCSQFTNCLECLSFDVAMEMGCVWSRCDARCLNSNATISCDHTARNYDDQLGVCLIDVCAYASCSECVSDTSCGWSSVSIGTNLEQERFTVLDFTEWGCYANGLNNALRNELNMPVTVATCPSPCSLATTCSECVQSDSSGAGSFHCVWETFTETCVQLDLSPLLCSEGLCGGFVTNSNQCPPPCSAYSDCAGCQGNTLCAWYGFNTDNGFCTDADNSITALQSHWSTGMGYYDWSAVLYYGAECPDCAVPDCSGRGLCLRTNQTCSCYLGYVGDVCEVECECGGLSHCANSSQSGRSVCLQCQHNTQVCMLIKIIINFKCF